MNTPVEYYYGDVLRWSFGFDNPNMAAVVFACAVPLLWWLWRMAWRPERMWLRVPALLVSAGLLGGAWYCLIMTFSRGGLLAAAVGMSYLIGREVWEGRSKAARWCRSSGAWVSVLLIAALIGAAVWNGLGTRSAEALGNDASVGNRIELWGSALQMAAENPQGFGAGNSGAQYMQWYQALDREEGYRTMVNSYLTFLVERGWPVSLAILAGCIVFWVWTRPQGGETFSVGLWGVILAFLSAGVFSTTMEEARLWIAPVMAAVLIAGLAIRNKRVIERRVLIVTATVVCVLCGALWVAGLVKSSRDPLRREFSASNGVSGVSAMGPRSRTSRSLGCVVDERIIGNQYAKPLRQLALEAGVRVVIGEGARSMERVLCMGAGVHSSSIDRAGKLMLLAPETITSSEIDALATRDVPVSVILPEIDEDGRVEFWEDISEGERASRFEMIALGGVGNRVDWAWEQVIELVKGG